MPGRVLSKKNESSLRAAAEQLAAVLALLDTDEDGDEEEATPNNVDVDAPVLEASIDGDFVPLVEKAIRRDGTIALKLIKAGWGSSGYYPASVLERDGPAVFPAKTQMFWDHPTAQDEALRPEGSLNDLAAELVSGARWDENGIDGPGLYADAKVFKPYQEAVNDLAPHIGVSIRAMGKAAQGEAEGRKGPIIQQLTAAKSADFVTKGGAGGKIIAMFEAARTPQLNLPFKEDNQVNEQQFTEALAARDTQIARLSEALILRDARDFVRERVSSATVPDVTKARLVESLSTNPPVVDGQLDTATYGTRISEAISAEVEYLTKAAGYGSGRVEGMGGTTVTDTKPQEIEERMLNAYRRMGLSEAQAQSAVKEK